MGLLEFPTYDKNDGILAGILAILLNGLGILIFGIIKKDKDRIILGLLCFLLSFLIIPAIFAFVWGIVVLVKSL